MSREEAIGNLIHAIRWNDMPKKESLKMAIRALEIVEEFERAQIVTGGRLNGRTYAYKCGLEDGKRNALPKTDVLDKIRAEILGLDDAADYDYEGYYKAVTDAVQIIDKYRQEG